VFLRGLQTKRIGKKFQIGSARTPHEGEAKRTYK
jgi:hypothetical protein